MDTETRCSMIPGSAGKSFYVEPDCCLLCGVPESIAPELFETGEQYCTVKRQPANAAEIDKMVRAMWSSEVGCIRYSGTDELILKRLGKAGMSGYADDLRAAEAVPLKRDRVTFIPPASLVETTVAATIAEPFRRHLREEGNIVLPAFLGRKTVRLSWYGRQFHSVRFEYAQRERAMIATLKSKNALVGLAWLVDAWLRSIGATMIEWRTDGSASNDENRSTPI
ncbi:ferredoxin [Sphingobium sp. LB126]|uniref:ferredoxin n=1 Tax=Sphingobium sp. LB126 TaxID=1983755 RepID=UPI0018D542D2|nr:ferredoxin [Sphingobium sp. LB126]